jgi:CBS domain-containing membrane protein
MLLLELMLTSSEESSFDPPRAAERSSSPGDIMKSQSPLTSPKAAHASRPQGLSVLALMTKDLIVVNWTDPLTTAYELMREKNIRHLPVLDDEGDVVGLISERDFMRALRVEQPDFASGYVPTVEFDPNHVVRDFMSWPVRAVPSNASIATAARLMVENKISALIVTEAETVLGIVTTEDLLRVLITQFESVGEKVQETMGGFLATSQIGRIAQAISDVGI